MDTLPGTRERYIYLEMPKFNKGIEELETLFDKWMFAMRHLPEFLEKPHILQEEIFSRLFEAAEIARFTPQEIYEYEESLKIYRDWYSITKTAVDKAKRACREEGRAEGRAEVTINIVKSMLDRGLDYLLISQVTGLTEEEIHHVAQTR